MIFSNKTIAQRNWFKEQETKMYLHTKSARQSHSWKYANNFEWSIYLNIVDYKLSYAQITFFYKIELGCGSLIFKSLLMRLFSYIRLFSDLFHRNEE